MGVGPVVIAHRAMHKALAASLDHFRPSNRHDYGYATVPLLMVIRVLSAFPAKVTDRTVIPSSFTLSSLRIGEKKTIASHPHSGYGTPMNHAPSQQEHLVCSGSAPLSPGAGSFVARRRRRRRRRRRDGLPCPAPAGSMFVPWSLRSAAAGSQQTYLAPHVSTGLSTDAPSVIALSAEKLRPNTAAIAQRCTAGHTGAVKVKLHYTYEVRNIGRVRPRLRFCVLC